MYRTNKYILSILLAAAVLSAAPAFSAPAPADAYLASHCAITPSIENEAYPGRDAIISSNKLALPAGKAEYPDGQLVFLGGRVFDENCVPISDAIVEIWQADPHGHYIHSTLGERLDTYPHFTGSGRATTDNLGRFSFVTLFPGAHGHAAPHIHFRVIHPHFATLTTEMFFAHDARNLTDATFRSLNPKLQERVSAKIWPNDPNAPDKDLIGEWDITLPGKVPYRHF